MPASSWITPEISTEPPLLAESEAAAVRKGPVAV